MIRVCIDAILPNVHFLTKRSAIFDLTLLVILTGQVPLPNRDELGGMSSYNHLEFEVSRLRLYSTT